MRNNAKMVYAMLVIAITIFAVLVDISPPGTFLKARTAFGQDSLQLLTTDADKDGKIESAKLSWPGAYYLGGGLGTNCSYSDFGYLNCPLGSDTCEIPLSFVPPGYSDDVYVWMWGYYTPWEQWTYDCQTVRVDDFVGPTPSSVVGVQTYGASYGELSARWWQWLLSIPKATNPSLGGDCAQGQDDDVWFLPGTFGGSATRTCTIPAGKPILLPLINTVAFKPTGGETLLDLRRLAAAFVDTVNVLECTIDGTALTNLRNFRVHSPSFSVIPPPGALLHPSATDPMVSDGYWLLLSPLPAGDHTIQVRTATSGGFSADVTYNLTIE